MTGVEILASEQVATDYIFNWTATWIVTGIVFAIFISVIIYTCIKNDLSLRDFIGDFALSVFVSLLGGLIFGLICRTPSQYTTEHKVTISDEVLMVEFYEHYEVIGQDGKIFTVREKS